MIQRTPLLDVLTYVLLAVGVAIVVLPLWFIFVAASLTLQEVNTPNVHLIPGDQLWINMLKAWERASLGVKLLNSLIMAVGVACGKVAIAMITAFALVFFRFPGRTIVFWLIFVTLMLPLEVRIVPTYAVAANALSPLQIIAEHLGLAWAWQTITGNDLKLEWNLLNTYTGLILPLIATATGTFLYRQFFMTIPDELVEAAKMDGAGALRFFRDILIPLSRTNIIALFTIMFLYAWNEYLWPLLITTDQVNFGNATIALRQLVPNISTTGGGTPDWNVAMAGALIVMLPPLLVVVLLQSFFIKGLIATDK
jgi:sn-glycerol 3-phosphate transport system permease protein